MILSLVDYRDTYYPHLTKRQCKKFYKEYHDNNWIEPVNCTECKTIKFKLAPLLKAVPAPCQVMTTKGWVDYEQEGKTPMRYNDNYASASVTSPKSDTATQRDYLLERLASAHYPKGQELIKLFNLYVNNTPKTYKDLIDAIKTDKFKLDDKRIKQMDTYDSEDFPDDYWPYNIFDGIIWDGPQPDAKGYKAAQTEMGKQYTAAKDIIMTGEAAAGLKALQDFEAWTPTPATTTAQ